MKTITLLLLGLLGCQALPIESRALATYDCEATTELLACESEPAVELRAALVDDTPGYEDSRLCAALRYQGSEPVDTLCIAQGGDLYVQAHGSGNEGPSIKFSTDTTGHTGAGGGQYGYHRPLGLGIWGRLSGERVYFGTADVPRAEISPTGHLTPYDDTAGTYDGDYDLGRTALRWRDLYLSGAVWLDVGGTMKQVKIGASGTGPGGSGRALYLD